MFDKIARHVGHSIEVASYGNHNYKPADNGVENPHANYANVTKEIVNVAVECMDCYEVIVDADNENHADEFNVEGYAVDSELSAAEADWEFELENCINCDKPLNSQGTCDECNKGMPYEWVQSIPKTLTTNLDGWEFDLIKGD